MQITVTESKKVKLTVYVDSETKKMFKTLSSEAGVSMGEYMEAIVDEKYTEFLHRLDSEGKIQWEAKDGKPDS